MTVYHGNILTVNPSDEVCRYLVEHRGRIVYVGNELPKKYCHAPIVELGERALIPPFADTHQHFASFSAFNAGLNVMEARSNREILSMVDRFAAESPAKTLIAFGASPYSVEERCLVSREELDSVTHGKPLFLVKYDGHACIVNTALLKKLPKKVKSLRGYHADTGEMNQEAFFAVSDYITNSISPLELLRDMQLAADFEASKGIGLIHTVSGVGFMLNLVCQKRPEWPADPDLPPVDGHRGGKAPQFAEAWRLLCVRAGRLLWLAGRVHERALRL